MESPSNDSELKGVDLNIDPRELWGGGNRMGKEGGGSDVGG